MGKFYTRTPHRDYIALAWSQTSYLLVVIFLIIPPFGLDFTHQNRHASSAKIATITACCGLMILLWYNVAQGEQMYLLGLSFTPAELWATAGIILLLLELLGGGFIFLGLGVSAVLIAIAGWTLSLSLVSTTAIIAWALLGTALVLLLRNKFANDSNHTMGQSSQYQGITGETLEPISPTKAGKVQLSQSVIGSRIWSASATESIEAGSSVEIVTIDGQQLTVKPTQSKE